MSWLLELTSNPDVGMTPKGHTVLRGQLLSCRGVQAFSLFESLWYVKREVRIIVVSALGVVAIGDALPLMGAASDGDWGDDDLDDTDPTKLDANDHHWTGK